MDTSTSGRLDKYRAKRLKFFINGDKFFRGINYALNTEKIRSFEYLLNDLNRLLNEQSISLIKGVRCIFSQEGNLVKDLIDFHEGQAYICSSYENFIQTDYQINNGVLNWLVRNSACISSSKSSKIKNNNSIDGKKTAQSRSSAEPNEDSFSKSRPCTDITRQTHSSSAKTRLSVRQSYNNTKSSGQVSPLDDKSVKSNARVRDVSSRRNRFLDTPKSRVRDSSVASNESSNHKLNEDIKHASQKNGVKSRHSNTPLKTNQVSKNSQTKQKEPNCNGQSVKHQTIVSSDNTKFPSEVTEIYDVGRPIGDGHFSVVHCCMNKKSQQFFALKYIDKLKCRGNYEMIYNEVKILKRLEHPNIVKLIEEFDYDSELFLVLELVQDGDLFDAITNVIRFDEVSVATMIYNLSSALTFLHSRGIVHRDIKPENLLITALEDGSQTLKLADFGLAVEVGQNPLYNICGTAFYVSPEMLNETGYGFKVDVWSTGVICYILLFGYPPFTSKNESNQDELFDAILAGDFQFPTQKSLNISNEAKNLIKSMLTVNPEERYTAEQVLKNPWTRGESSNFGGIDPLNMSRLASNQGFP